MIARSLLILLLPPGNCFERHLAHLAKIKLSNDVLLAQVLSREGPDYL